MTKFSSIYKNIVSESPDSIWKDPSAITFFYVESKNEIYTKLFKQKIPEIDKLKFPILIQRDDDKNLVILQNWKPVRKTVKVTTPGTFENLNTHYGLLVAFVNVFVDVFMVSKDLEKIVDIQEDRDLGYAGRYSFGYFTTWKKFGKDGDLKVRRILDWIENAKFKKFENIVKVEESDWMNENSKEDKYKVDRNKNGRFQL